MKINVEDIKFKIGKKDVLNGINIDVKNKEFIGIIGPNGSGKSTLLKCIYRILKPTSGIIRLDDINLNDLTTKESARKMAVVSQHNYYDFDFSVSEIVLMGRSPHKKLMERDSLNDYEIMEESLKKVDMLNCKDRNFNTLSGGEQQRIILARALAQKTDCLILDEPTNHLDIKYQLQLMNTVKNLDIEVIAAIHDLNMASMYCDKIYVLKDGYIVAYGNPKEILTKELIKDVYEVDAVVNYDDGLDLVNIIYKL
ncbi:MULTISPECIES: ABC transporter ATP-binding protein [unclassified Romboutsia]|uniref:ABC transporter ATP-binding protein n=1 Tax=unclassified Romboutsia TaxID=2626894 RepID=UPI00082213DE|nr:MULTISPECIES: ABC transporter ATP-binding protein [unclassified Romboutsia]SCH88252.1 Hemin import ATP-binding protein HmuV [uncultured Clostridium sp.]